MVSVRQGPAHDGVRWHGEGTKVAQTYENVDDYIRSCPAEAQVVLEEIRRRVHDIAPKVGETISYQMPAFKLNGKNLVYFAGWQKHIGFYATPGGNEAFKKELSPYQGAKGSVQFPLDQPMPYELIKKIAIFRMEEIQRTN